MEILDELMDDSSNQVKERHGCVTAWLVLMLIASSVTTLIIFFFGASNIRKYAEIEVSLTSLWLLGIIGVANIVFSILLLKWKKIGFWGFLTTSIITFAINMNLGIDLIQSLQGLFGFIVLYAILQIEKKNKKAWDNLE